MKGRLFRLKQNMTPTIFFIHFTMMAHPLIDKHTTINDSISLDINAIKFTVPGSVNPDIKPPNI